jgi:hypothetical protein
MFILFYFSLFGQISIFFTRIRILICTADLNPQADRLHGTNADQDRKQWLEAAVVLYQEPTTS